MKKIWLVALLFLAAVIGVVLTSNPSPSSEAYSSTGVPPVMETARQAGRLPYTPAATSEAAQLAPFFSAPIILKDGGRERAFELAADQLYLRGEDGASRLLMFPVASTPEVFAAAMEKARAEHGTEPELVLYPAGFPRDEYTRRIVTREVVVNAPTRAEADALAAAQGLVFRKAPVFAPTAFVYEAPTSATALGVLTKQEVASADATPLLASLAVKKTMPNDPFVQLQWHLKYQGQQGAVEGTDIDVESVWNYPSTSIGNSTRGRGVVIGIVDDGMEWSHPDLAPNAIKELQYDWNGKDNDPKPDYYKVDENGYPDPDNHGTACAGVAAARGNNRIGVSGVAPEAKLAGMRLISGPQTDLDIAEAMTWKMGDIHVLSNSWGYPAFRPTPDWSLAWYPLRETGALTEAALKYAVDYGRGGRGTIITFAAGNSDEFYVMQEDQSITREKSGARMDFSALQSSIYTIAVGAVNSVGVKSNYSQIGAALLVSAPSNTTDGSGLGVMTTDNKGRFGYNRGFHKNDFASSGDVTKTFGGTSSACPVVSGVIALMLEKNPDLGWRDVQEILIRSAAKVDEDDADWIENAAGLHFNHKYGAGLVDAAEAVDLASTWINLGPQKSETVTTNETTAIGGYNEITREFAVSGDIFVEHVTLRLTIEDIKKGDLTITLTSPSGTESTFCVPHSDNDPEDGNEFTNWRFMTVRNWGEFSSGEWKLKITNNESSTGALTAAELVVYGSDPDAEDPPVVTLAASKTSVFVGSNLTLTATAKDRNNDRIETLVAFAGAEPLGASSNGTWTIQANKPGNYTFTVNATDGNLVVGTSNAVEVEVIEAPIAAWDFDTALMNPVPLPTAVQGTKTYKANFGSGTLTFNGSFTESGISNFWNDKNGEIWVGYGTDKNAAGELWKESLTSKSLLLRGGKNIAEKGKSIVFEFNMSEQGSLIVSYATDSEPFYLPLKDEDGDQNYDRISGGFTTHTWYYSKNGTGWLPLQTVNPTPGYSVVTLNATDELKDAPSAYLRLVVSGALVAYGQNLIDNIILSASPITVDPVSEDFTVLARAASKAEAGGIDSLPAQSQEAPDQQAQAGSGGSEDSQDLDWVLGPPSIHEMTVHAEVVAGGEFVNASGNLLSATEDGKVLGLAEPVPQTTRYDLGITSSDPAPEPLRLKVYDSKSKGILVLEEKVPFAPGATIGSPSTPKRYKVAYQEAEQVVSISPGWNTFTTAVDPDPATLAGAFAEYDYSEGDELVGPDVQAVVVNGKWNPVGVKLEPQATYSLLRQDQTASQIILKGKALAESSTPLPVKPVELPPVKSSAAFSNSGHTHSPAPAASSAGGTESAFKIKNSTKGSKKTKSLNSSKKKSAKKSKNKTS